MNKITLFALCGLCVLCGLINAQESSGQQKELPPDLKLFTEGYSLALEGKHKEALDRLAEVEKQYPESTYLDRVLFWKAWCHTEMKNYGKAIKLYNELVEKYPKSAYADDALFKVGEIYENYQHDYEKAIETYERLVKLYPAPDEVSNYNANLSNSIVQAQQQKAQIVEQINRNPQQALNDWQVSQELNKKYNPRRGQKDDYFDRRAQERIEFIKGNSDNDFLSLTKFTEGEVLIKNGKYDKAVKKFQELLKEYPDCSLADNASYEIALCLKKQDKPDEAEELLKEFKQKYPKSELVEKTEQLFKQWAAEKESKNAKIKPVK